VLARPSFPGLPPPGLYSPPVCNGTRKLKVFGNPDPSHVSTSDAERNNLNVRMHSRRMTRLTNAFSKKVENHTFAMALHFLYYNFVRVHQTLRASPAMAAGVSKRLWEIKDVVDMLKHGKQRSRRALFGCNNLYRFAGGAGAMICALGLNTELIRSPTDHQRRPPNKGRNLPKRERSSSWQRNRADIARSRHLSETRKSSDE